MQKESKKSTHNLPLGGKTVAEIGGIRWQYGGSGDNLGTLNGVFWAFLDEKKPTVLGWVLKPSKGWKPLFMRLPRGSGGNGGIRTLDRALHPILP